MYTFLIPAFNEEKRIRSTLSAITSAFPNNECLVVFDGNDHTPDVVSTFSGVKLITYDKRLGKGKAIMEGFKCLNSKSIIVLIDADLPVMLLT
ncbi:MAG: glycosyltransferase [Conexivisphaerales archaeon]